MSCFCLLIFALLQIASSLRVRTLAPLRFEGSLQGSSHPLFIIDLIGASEIRQFRSYARPRKIDQEAEALGASSKASTNRGKKSKRSRDTSNETVEHSQQDNPTIDIKSASSNVEEEKSEGTSETDTSVSSSQEEETREASSNTFTNRQDLFS